MGVRKRRRPRSDNGEVIANPFDCRCAVKSPMAVLTGMCAGATRASNGKVRGSLVCSVVAAMKHVSVPVCTWDESDVDEIQVTGIKLSKRVVEYWWESSANRKRFCKLLEHQRLFGRMQSVSVGPPKMEVFDMNQECKLYEDLQEMLLSDGMCLLEIQGSTVVIIHHQDYYVVVDCGACSESGLPRRNGSSVAVFNTNLNDLMLHIRAVRQELRAKIYRISSLSVKADDVTDITEGATVCRDSNISVTKEDVTVVAESVAVCRDSSVSVTTDEMTVVTESVRFGGDSIIDIDSRSEDVEDCFVAAQEGLLLPVIGSFHQGDDRFMYGGQQCMAISLVGIARHTFDSVFSWTTAELDKVLLLGDQLYTDLRDGGRISGKSELLCIPDLPKQFAVDGQNLAFVYGDCVSGHVDVVAGELIDAGVQCPLKCGLQEMCVKYDACFFTVGGNTSAIIGHNGCYAVIDSHARNEDGMMDGDGKSVVVYFSCLDFLFDHIWLFSRHLSEGQRVFEITGACVSKQESSEEVCMFFDPITISQVNEDEVPCTLAQETVFVKSHKNTNTMSKDAAMAYCDSEKVQSIHDDATLHASDEDDVVVSEVITKTLQFNPLCSDVVQTLCTKLNVLSEKVDAQSVQVGDLGVPCKNVNIVADGNCFFRAVSHAVCGTQLHHKKIRASVCKHLQNSDGAYNSLLRSGYDSMQQYLEISKMKYVGSWATEIEIQAVSDCFGVHVFTFHDNRWIKYSSLNNVLSNQGIYLENCNGNHYETVVCVQQLHGQSCYGYCKETISSVTGRALRQRAKGKDHCVDGEHVHAVFPSTSTMSHAVKTVDFIKQEPKTLSANDNIDSRFKPLSLKVARTLCNKCDIDFGKPDVQGAKVSEYLGDVCKTDSIVQDGNSFFRAVTQVISGSQKRHLKVRRAVVQYMEKNGADLLQLVDREYKSLSDYITKTKVKYVGHSATNVEIQATANAFGLDIHCFGVGTWQSFTCKSKVFDEGIYLKQCDNNHYEQVVCVKSKEQLYCTGLCDVGTSETKYMCRRDNCFSNGRHSSQNVKEGSIKKYDSKSYRWKVRESSIWKYKVNVLHRQNVKDRSTGKYRDNVVHRQKAMESSIGKYRDNVVHRQKAMESSIGKYRDNVVHRQKAMESSIGKYRDNVVHRQKAKESSIGKYKINTVHRQNVKERSIGKYKDNALHRLEIKALNKRKYWLNPMHRQNVRTRNQREYHVNHEYKMRVAAGNKRKRQEKKVKSEEIDFVMQQFLDKVKDGPDFVCCVCHRMLFCHQVLLCKRGHYNKSTAIASLADKCINEKYLHKCSGDCVLPCRLMDTPRSQLWICYTCHGKINKGVLPPECAMNNMAVDPIPAELACLNSLEQHLIALNIPFMKMLALPKGGQNGVHGPVTCVPANIVQTSNLLPRSSMEGSLLPVKLKRKLTYKGHYEYQFVDDMHIRKALKLLKDTNVHYKDVVFNEDWSNDFCKETHSDVSEKDTDCTGDGAGVSADNGEDELLHDRQQHCMYQDTCLMPVDIGQEALDQSFDNVLNLAPAEGNNPVRLLSDDTNEAKCFPVLFPKGCPTYRDFRQHRLTSSRYFNNRILHADGRFARNVEYIFFALYMSEVEQVVSCVSIALRKGRGGKFQKVPGDVLNNEEGLKRLLEYDDGFRFLKPIRGTPSFWQGAQRELLACVRQLGIPTWFASFSCADMRWKNLLTSILTQEGRTETVEELEWAERCELLRRNPVTAARLFDFRWHCFLREVLMSRYNPIGKITDYYYRVEFQQRGSPHIHGLFWIEDAPVIDRNTDEEVVAFIDKYVTCELPTEDETLLEIVTAVQTHSKRHSKTCKKKGTVCRFTFPRLPSLETFISRGVGADDEKSDMRKEDAVKILNDLKAAILDGKADGVSVQQLFAQVGITQADLQAACRCYGRKTEVVLKRRIDAIWINHYSKVLLKIWNANIDIQFVSDAYACVVYIISYISKGEREMGMLLANAQREAAKEGNASAKDALKNLGSVYLHNRDVCAQEAVYRLANMHLKECSRKVVFVPVGENAVKMSLPLSVLKQKASSKDLSTEDMWMTSLVDRYRSRPKDSTFNDMCLATFASEYRILSKNERSPNRIALSNDCGFILRRTRTQPAVIRYVRFSETKSPELFHQSILQMFLPYRMDVQLRPEGFVTFEEFYRGGHVKLDDGWLHSVKSVVDVNRKLYEMDADVLDDIQNTIDRDGIIEDAWCKLCPEAEMDRLECVQLRADENQVVDEHTDLIPDLAVTREQVAHLEKRANVMCRNDGLALIRSLNETQMCIFYQIRQWCLAKVMGEKPDPLHVFITGGAGTGKSHLIKAIQYEATRLLSTVSRQPDDICVLLTAPTGIAAHNLHASTIHSALSIGVDVRLPYIPLGEEKVNSLRAKYRSLQILIIDEISMVSHNLLAYIHGRLRQMKQSRDLAPFGNVSVVVVGDFFQLPPVRGKPLYVNNIGFDLWMNIFKVVELHTVVRQQDDAFAQLLNRVRTRSKGTPMLAGDIEILKRCETGEVSSALHIFSTNKQVNEHNVVQLAKTCPDFVEIKAQDFVNCKATGKLKLMSGHHSRVQNTCLDESLALGIDARVMLIKNVDVADGLVNGVCGTVTHIVYPSDSRNFPDTVYVKFDDNQVGAEMRKRCAYSVAVEMGSTGIRPEEERVTTKGGLRRQFPLKLAWACTVHKVQGLTVDEAVVCLKRIFAPGQAYVALSRVRSLSGLVIQDFEDKVIYCKDDIKDAIKNMPPFLVESISRQSFTNANTHSFTLFLMNVQNLSRHITDLVSCTKHLQLNCIAVTETWLPEAFSSESVKIQGYSFQNQPRSSSYSSSNHTLANIQEQQHGGVGMYSLDSLPYEVIKVPHLSLECLVYNYTTSRILIAVVYRPPSYPMSQLKDNLTKLINWLEPICTTVAVIGDFNDNIFKSSSISNFMAEKGYIQYVTQATTEKGTLIDHIYIKTTFYDIETVVSPTYFSDHEGITCSFTSRSMDMDLGVEQL